MNDLYYRHEFTQLLANDIKYSLIIGNEGAFRAARMTRLSTNLGSIDSWILTDNKEWIDLYERLKLLLL